MTTSTQATGEQQAADEPRCTHGNPIEVFCNGCEEDRAEFQQNMFAALRNAGAQEIDLSEPRGLARLDAAGLAELRALILRVIDDGDPAKAKYAKALRGWHFYHDPCDGVTGFTEAMADAQRLDFADAIQAAVVAAAAPAAGRKP